jgi:hypothetical protein
MPKDKLQGTSAVKPVWSNRAVSMPKRPDMNRTETKLSNFEAPGKQK